MPDKLVLGFEWGVAAVMVSGCCRAPAVPSVQLPASQSVPPCYGNARLPCTQPRILETSKRDSSYHTVEFRGLCLWQRDKRRLFAKQSFRQASRVRHSPPTAGRPIHVTSWTCFLQPLRLLCVAGPLRVTSTRQRILKIGSRTRASMAWCSLLILTCSLRPN